MDARLGSRLHKAAFEHNLQHAGGNAGQSIHDLTTLRQFVTGNGIFAFFDAPWFPIYLALIFFFNTTLGVFALAGTALLVLLAWVNEVATRSLMSQASGAAVASGNLATNSLRNAEVIQAMGMLPRPAAPLGEAAPAVCKAPVGRKPAGGNDWGVHAPCPHVTAVPGSRYGCAIGSRGPDVAGDDDCRLHPGRPGLESGGTGHRCMAPMERRQDRLCTTFRACWQSIQNGPPAWHCLRQRAGSRWTPSPSCRLARKRPRCATSALN